MVTETVTVITRLDTGRTDTLGEPIYDTISEDVEGVLVRYRTADERDELRDDGIRLTVRMEFPKTYDGDLRGAAVIVRGDELIVAGDPRHVIQSLLPWDMHVDAGVKDG